MKMASITRVCHKPQKKAAGFFHSCEVLLEFRGHPVPPLHSIPHHLVEQIVVEDDTLTSTGVFNVKDQIGDAVVR